MQMAVETNQQGKGIGKLLVNELLSSVQNHWRGCHSRENAVAFYLKSGFEIYDALLEVGIKHSHMRINI
jgi:predicted GNAT family N-acyltransferase